MCGSDSIKRGLQVGRGEQMAALAWTIVCICEISIQKALLSMPQCLPSHTQFISLLINVVHILNALLLPSTYTNFLYSLYLKMSHGELQSFMAGGRQSHLVQRLKEVAQGHSTRKQCCQDFTQVLTSEVFHWTPLPIAHRVLFSSSTLVWPSHHAVFNYISS